MAYIHVYGGTPTAGGTNGTQLSEGTGLTPLSVGPLNATNNEVSSWQKLALRCETGYTTSDAVVQPVGTNASKWQLAPDAAGSPGTPTAYGAAAAAVSVSATNVIFWARAKADSGENPQNDVTVDLQVTATIAAV